MNYTIENILKASDKQIINFLNKKFLNSTTDNKNFFYVNNKSNTTLIAHIDTVRFSDKPVETVFHGDYIYNLNGILGADDRAGVFALLFIYDYLINEKYKPNLLFTTGEEHGNIGIKEFCKKHAKIIKKSKLFIELDRQGKNDFVTYDFQPDKDAKRFFTSYGFKEASGSFSDISEIITQFSIPCVNFSIGYYNAHTNKEYLCISEMFSTIFRVIDLLRGGIPELKGNFYNDDFQFDCYAKPYKKNKRVINFSYDKEFCPLCNSELIFISPSFYCENCNNVFNMDLELEKDF